MKLSYRQIEPFVQRPDSHVRVILVYGPDQGLMRERASIMGKTVVEDLTDPFNVITLNMDILNEDPARLSDEANAMSMMGGRRLIRIEDAGDKLTQSLKDYLENPNDNALIILEAGELSPRSSLRKLCESAKNAAAAPCYIESEQDIARLIRGAVQEDNHRIDNDAVQWLAANIAGDRGRARSEMEKVLLYKGGEDSPISLSEAQAICGQAGAQTMDDLVYAVAGGVPTSAMRAFQTLMDEGVALIAILRGLQMHIRKLHKTKALVMEGQSLDQAMKNLSPPIFFKQQDAFKGQVHKWSLPALSRILERLNQLEVQCKTSNLPYETLCGQTILGIATSKRR